MSGTTTNYAWTYPTSTDYVKDGASAIQTLATGIDSTLGTALNNKLHSGLVLVKTQTVGTGVSSVTVTGAFSATYDAYKIIFTGGVLSGAADIGFRIGASTTGYYQTLVYAAFATDTALANGQSNYANIRFAGFGDTTFAHLDLNLYNPYQASYTKYANAGQITATTFGIEGGVHKVATSYTDFTLIPSTGTLTGGTIAVYGYAKD